MSDLGWFDILFVLAALLAFVVAIAPILHYNRYGHLERRQEVIEYFKSEHIELYYDTWYRARSPTATEFAQFYDQRFGWPSYRIPFATYVLALVVAFIWIILTAFTNEFQQPHASELLPAAYALVGAYLWIIYDLLSRFARRDIVPTRLYGYTVRLVIVIPLAYVLSEIASNTFRPFALIALGAFPTETIYRILRRQGAKAFQIPDEALHSEYELELLQGVNRSKAERFGDAGVDSILELACQDPIQLTMRTNFAFRFVIDGLSQAVLYMYLPKLEIARRYAVRSAMDAADIYEQYYGTGEDEERDEHKQEQNKKEEEKNVPERKLGEQKEERGRREREGRGRGRR